MSIRPCTEDLIAFLNALLRCDRAWLSELIAYRPYCSHTLADHPTVQTTVCGEAETACAGLLGLLNGFCGIVEYGNYAGYGPIAACYEDDGVTITQFVRTEDMENPRTKGCDV